jgi:hypothetical protein
MRTEVKVRKAKFQSGVRGNQLVSGQEIDDGQIGYRSCKSTELQSLRE